MVIHMKLSKAGLENRAQWEAAGYALPEFDREAVTAATKEAPLWNPVFWIPETKKNTAG